MSYCRNCGHELDDKAYICPGCGVLVEKKPMVIEPENPSLWWGVLGFVLPLIGLIMYLVWENTKPKTSKILGKGALAGFIFWIVSIIIVYILIVFIWMWILILIAQMY